MHKFFKDKVIIITGASSGIGLAAARLFASYGARLSLAARSIERLHSLAKEMTDDEYTGYEADVEKSVTKAIEGVEKATAEKEKEILTV